MTADQAGKSGPCGKLGGWGLPHCDIFFLLLMLMLPRAHRPLDQCKATCVGCVLYKVDYERIMSSPTESKMTPGGPGLPKSSNCTPFLCKTVRFYEDGFGISVENITGCLKAMHDRIRRSRISIGWNKWHGDMPAIGILWRTYIHLFGHTYIHTYIHTICNS